MTHENDFRYKKNYFYYINKKTKVQSRCLAEGALLFVSGFCILALSAHIAVLQELAVIIDRDSRLIS